MKTTQKDRILAYIREFGSITPIEAFFDLGVMRLASRISDLKRDGVDIAVEFVTKKNRFGEPTTFARYSFPKDRIIVKEASENA